MQDDDWYEYKNAPKPCNANPKNDESNASKDRDNEAITTFQNPYYGASCDISTEKSDGDFKTDGVLPKFVKISENPYYE